jgi:hypothetical protein
MEYEWSVSMRKHVSILTHFHLYIYIYMRVYMSCAGEQFLRNYVSFQIIIRSVHYCIGKLQQRTYRRKAS